MKSSFEIYVEKGYVFGYTEKKKGAVIMRAMHPVKVFGDGRLSEYLYGIFCIWKRDLCR